MLHLADEQKSWKTFDVLLKYFTDGNIKDGGGVTVLHLVCKRGNLSAVKALVERGAQLFLQDNIGRTPMDEAIGSGNRELMEYLTSCDVLKVSMIGNIVKIFTNVAY